MVVVALVTEYDVIRQNAFCTWPIRVPYSGSYTLGKEQLIFTFRGRGSTFLHIGEDLPCTQTKADEPHTGHAPAQLILVM